MDREGGVVRLHNGIGDFRRWNNREGCHHAIWELLANFGDQQCSHTSTSTTSKGVGDLKALQAVAALGFTTNDIKNLVNKLCSLSVMTLGPVVSSTRLTEDEVIGTEELTERTSSDRVHCARFKVDEDSARDIFVVGCVEVHVHSLELKVRGAIVAVIVNDGLCTARSYRSHARAIKAMLARDDLPMTGSESSSKKQKSR
jgi:hypothetical protein